MTDLVITSGSGLSKEIQNKVVYYLLVPFVSTLPSWSLVFLGIELKIFLIIYSPYLFIIFVITFALNIFSNNSIRISDDVVIVEGKSKKLLEVLKDEVGFTIDESRRALLVYYPKSRITPRYRFGGLSLADIQRLNEVISKNQRCDHKFVMIKRIVDGMICVAVLVLPTITIYLKYGFSSMLLFPLIFYSTYFLHEKSESYFLKKFYLKS